MLYLYIRLCVCVCVCVFVCVESCETQLEEGREHSDSLGGIKMIRASGINKHNTQSTSSDE